MRLIKILVAVFCVGYTLQAVAQEESTLWTSSRPDGHAPIGVMGDHIHKKGEFMMSYRYMGMKMEDNRTGSDDISTSAVLQTYMIAPTSMEMTMHMLGGMYAISDRVTLMAMLNYQESSMDHLTRMGATFTTESSSFGDVKLSTLYGLLNKNKSTLHLTTGISLPLGSITQRDATPMGDNQKLPYPMQIGSGTFDFLPGLTFQNQADRISWGAQLTGNIRLGENGEGYRLGNSAKITSWASYKLCDWASFSARLVGKTMGDISGMDDDLNPMIVQTADPENHGGSILDSVYGMNLYIRDGLLKGHRIGLEYQLPLYQNLNGPQLSVESGMTIGWQYAF